MGGLSAVAGAWACVGEFGATCDAAGRDRLAGAATDLAAFDGGIVSKQNRQDRSFWGFPMAISAIKWPCWKTPRRCPRTPPNCAGSGQSGCPGKSQALQIEKLKHEPAGHRRHRFGSRPTLDQLQLRLEDEEIAAAKADKPARPTRASPRPGRSANLSRPICRATPKCCRRAICAASAAANSRRWVRMSPKNWSMSLAASS